MRILVINGPNINMLGIREPEIYGNDRFSDLQQLLNDTAIDEHIHLQQFQSNHEGAIVDEIQNALGMFDGIVINAAAYTHTSIAILDALKAVGIPAVEVHITDISKREAFRQVSYPSVYCEKTIMGKGFLGYVEAIQYLKEKYGK